MEAEKVEKPAREKAFLEYLLQAHNENVKSGLGSAQDPVTPDPSPGKILPRSLTAAPVKKAPTYRAEHSTEMITPQNLRSLAELSRVNRAYDQQQRRERQAKRMQASKAEEAKIMAAPLVKTLSSMSMESQVSIKSGNTLASPPLEVEKTGKIESLFTPPPKFRLQIPCTVREVEDKDDQTEKRNMNDEDMYKRDFGMSREQIREKLSQQGNGDMKEASDT